jgi:hypothetical protein
MEDYVTRDYMYGIRGWECSQCHERSEEMPFATGPRNTLLCDHCNTVPKHLCHVTTLTMHGSRIGKIQAWFPNFTSNTEVGK